jgi:di/tripeptidase
VQTVGTPASASYTCELQNVPWPPDGKAVLLQRMVQEYTRLFRAEPVVKAAHAGHDCFDSLT